jgi:hypothetical protein
MFFHVFLLLIVLQIVHVRGNKTYKSSPFEFGGANPAKMPDRSWIYAVLINEFHQIIWIEGLAFTGYWKSEKPILKILNMPRILLKPGESQEIGLYGNNHSGKASCAFYIYRYTGGEVLFEILLTSPGKGTNQVTVSQFQEMEMKMSDFPVSGPMGAVRFTFYSPTPQNVTNEEYIPSSGQLPDEN